MRYGAPRRVGVVHTVSIAAVACLRMQGPGGRCRVGVDGGTKVPGLRGPTGIRTCGVVRGIGRQHLKVVESMHFVRIHAHARTWRVGKFTPSPA